jgi:hypothetical protein
MASVAESAEDRVRQPTEIEPHEMAPIVQAPAKATNPDSGTCCLASPAASRDQVGLYQRVKQRSESADCPSRTAIAAATPLPESAARPALRDASPEAQRDRARMTDTAHATAPATWSVFGVMPTSALRRLCRRHGYADLRAGSPAG